MKTALKEHLQLSPLDTSKDLVIWTDAAPSEGMCYVLAQWKDHQDESHGVNIIACDCKTFKKGKRGHSPFEAELSGVHWALTKEDYYCRGAPKITVMCDAKSMAGFLAQDLDKIDNVRALNMVAEFQQYNVEIRYVPGPCMKFPDHGSRNPISSGQHKLFDTEVGSLGICVRSNRVLSIDVKDPKVEILAAVAMEDENYLRDIEHIEQQSDLELV